MGGGLELQDGGVRHVPTLRNMPSCVGLERSQYWPVAQFELAVQPFSQSLTALSKQYVPGAHVADPHAELPSPELPWGGEHTS